MLVAQASAPALRQKDALPVFGQIRDHLVRVLVADDRADRKLDRHIVSGVARAIRAHAVLSAAGLPLALKLEVIEGVEASRGDDVHRSARSAVAARGTTL